MDSGSHHRGNQRKIVDQDTAQWRHKPFSEIETHFLNLLTSDMEEAERWFQYLRRGSLTLTPLERASKERLIGRYHEVRSNHAKSLAWTRKAMEAFEELGCRQGVYQCLLTMFAAYMNSGRYEDARACARQTFSSAARTDSEKMKIHINLGSLEHRLHRYQPALNHFKAALKLLCGNPAMEAIILYNMANVQVCLNKFTEAENNYHRALELFQSQRADLYQAHVLQALGYLHSILGQYFHAETGLARARDLYMERGDLVGAALCDFDLFQQKIRLNEFEAALVEVDRLIDTFQQLDLPYETGLVYYHAANAAIAESDYALAEIYLEEAINFFIGADNRHFLALCSMLQGILCWKMGDAEEARGHFGIAHRIFTAKKLKEPELECLIYLCRIEARRLDDHEYRRVRRLLAAPVGLQVRTRALLLVSEYWYAKGQIKRAIENRFEALMTIEESRASIISEDLRESFFGDKTEAYESLIEWLFQWKNPRASHLIFKILGLSRGRQFVERLSQLDRLPPVLNRKEPTLLAMSKLKTRLDQLNRKLRGFSDDLNYSETEKATLLAAYEETLLTLKRLKSGMRDEERLGIYFPFDIAPEEIQKYLPDGCLVVSYFLSAKRLYRVELDRSGLKTFSLPIPANFRKDLNLLSFLLSGRMLGKKDKIDALARETGAALLPKRLTKNRHVVFIPHKALQAFPFSLLTHKGNYLIQTHTISLCPNLPTLYFNLKKEKAALAHPVFFFSQHENDPAAGERSYLIEKYPNAPVYRNLPEKNFPKRVLRSDFIHFAGHCAFNKDDPSMSHMEMAGERLYLSRLRNQRLNRPFINLASCQSGSMALRAGNELYGFVVSFFAMGATNILAGMWDIDDEATSDWMVYFYKNIHLGPAKAYRKACLSMMATQPEPYFWAGFCLFGKPC